MAHSFPFSTIAGTVQARLLRGADVGRLAELDRKYWLMLSCAVTAMGPEGEPVARALDTDGDGRVRVPEVLAAVAWLRPRLSSFDRLFEPAEGLTLADIAADTEAGAPLAQLFARLVPEGTTLTEATIGEAFAAFRAAPANGDGVVPPTAAGEAFAALGEAMLAVTGGTPAADGAPGLSTAALEAFDNALAAYRAWCAAQPGERLPGGLAPAEATAAAVRLRPRVQAYFLDCDLLRYNPAAAEAIASPKCAGELADAPLAMPSASARALPFADGVNPLYAADVATVAALAEALEPGAEALTPELWGKVWGAVAPFVAWAAAKPAGADAFAALPPEVLALAESAEARAAFGKALADDAAQAPLAAAFDDLRRLLTLRVGLLRFLRNFVNAEDLYPPRARALFQTGTLLMDGRACALCFPIEQAAAAHAAAATPSNCCLAYCALTRPAEKRSRTICAVFTAGSAATLAVGRNGVFFDLEGKDWEATLVHLVPNPMGLGEAFFAPWRRIGSAVAGAVRKVVAGKDATDALAAKAEAAVVAAKPAAPANGGAVMASVATLGIALSFAATAVTGILAALTNTPVWKTGLAVLGVILVVSVPSVILTWFRLRARDLAPILNASGWAVNRRIGLTPALGRFFTQRAVYLGRRFVPGPPMTRARRWPVWVATLVALTVFSAVAWWFFCPRSPRNRAPAVETPAQTSPEVK